MRFWIQVSSVVEGQVKLSCRDLQDTSGGSLLPHVSSFPSSSALPPPHWDTQAFPSLGVSAHVPVQTRHPHHLEGSRTPEFFLEENEEKQRRTSDLLTFPWSQQQPLKMPESHHHA